MAEHRYSYTVRYPRPYIINEGEMEDHKLVLKVRRDKLTPPPNHLRYEARCTCKWNSRVWHRTLRLTKLEFQDHINEVSRQGRLM